jgi:hypothetical protein
MIFKILELLRGISKLHQLLLRKSYVMCLGFRKSFVGCFLGTSIFKFYIIICFFKLLISCKELAKQSACLCHRVHSLSVSNPPNAYHFSFFQHLLRL